MAYHCGGVTTGRNLLFVLVYFVDSSPWAKLLLFSGTVLGASNTVAYPLIGQLCLKSDLSELGQMTSNDCKDIRIEGMHRSLWGPYVRGPVLWYTR